MPDPGGRLRTVLDGYAKFVRNKELALPKHQPCLVREFAGASGSGEPIPHHQGCTSGFSRQTLAYSFALF